MRLGAGRYRFREASAPTATCRKELLQAQKNLAMALENAKISLARTVVVAKERDAVTVKYVELSSSMENRVGFANNEMVCLKAKIVKTTRSGTLVWRRKSSVT